MIGFYAAGAMGSGGGGGALSDIILSHSPFMYFRHDESSGTTAVNAGTGADGIYQGSYSLGNAALYAGGPTSFAVTGSSGMAVFDGTGTPSLGAMTIGCIYRPAEVSGLRMLVTRDTESGPPRYWQWRVNGAEMDFVKIVDGVLTVSTAHGMSAGNAYFLAITVATDGTIKQFVNGTQVGADGSVPAANYGTSSGTGIVVGNRFSQSEGQANDRFSESFVIASELSEAQILALAQAAGFA